MKRAVNKVNLSTIIGMIPAFAKVVIEDRKEGQIWHDHSPDTVKWSGLAKDFYRAGDTIRYRWGMTAVRMIEQSEDGIRIIISTQYEEY